MRLLFALALLLAPQDPVQLRFKFAKGDKEAVRMKLDLTQLVEVHVGAETMDQKTSGPIRFTIQQQCASSERGEYRMDVSFSDLEMVQDIQAGLSKIKMIVKGKNVRIEDEDGRAVVDTEKGVNPDQAEEVLKELEPFFEKGDFTLDEFGRMKDLGKNPKIKELLGAVGGDGLYPLVLPEKAVKSGDEWTVTTQLEKLGEMKLTKPIEVPIKFRLARIEGDEAVIEMKQDHTLKDATCEGEMPGIGKTKVTITEMKVTGKGESRVSISKGRFLTSTVEAEVTGTMEMKPKDLDQLVSVYVKTSVKGTLDTR